MSHNLEDWLREALRPVDPGEAFTQQVLARVASEHTRAARGRRLALHASWMAVAACLVLAIALTHEWQVERTRQGLAARRQLIEALRLTDQKLDLACRVVNASQRRVRSSGA